MISKRYIVSCLEHDKIVPAYLKKHTAREQSKFIILHIIMGKAYQSTKDAVPSAMIRV